MRTVIVNDIAFLVVWNGEMDRDQRCFSLTGDLRYANRDGTDRKHGGRADRKLPDRRAATYAKARREVSR